ncbi:MAG: nucleotidyl transferase AbiEii/AbiGii toxin family protein [Actinobacteria bacterium]|nr:nucleotidyl transferase AbiEii/AbiGii toxin family protein [Actinomycetota bacterium]MCG2818309.1 nucleotidyl transferase AbiEii/AbiGii toxin family protein [Actinomycetes bacterium]MBU4218691.1 nucleotidyl transferase AbiEii/AbiGii toxin family protein [Actinomycetota bacterium]MBU4359069.1 nucleotidyl transferase AbiEii/AbiGii toxin family protein [Actinomycetota bacterium]MBU4393208.1 nucleotidyl transferase AbiEii/AbiGii toxin family protein [Actinomycetota bacterium]
MTRGQPANVAASVRRRLLNIIRETGDDANLVWTCYANERLLYRLSVSEYAGDFVLKGAMLFMAWTGQSHRPTVDMDFLGYGEDSSERLTEVFRNVCAVGVEPDGLEFRADSVKATPIREEHEYHGQRVTLTAFLGKARITIQVDIGFGDVLTPRARKINYPTLLDFPAPRIRACPRETVVAEKLQAMVILGIANSRMKDFYDLYVLARDFEFNGATLTRAIKATFTRRGTGIPSETPLALTEEFGQDDMKSVQWKAFIRKSGLEQGVPELLDVLSHLREFLLPPLGAASGKAHAERTWSAGGPWMSAKSEDDA